jgi:Protein of unknown function (DUF2568)
MLEVLRLVNLGLRGLMELGIVIALSYWGYRTGHSPIQRALFGTCAPILVFSIWTFVDFRKLVAVPEPFRLIQELVLSGLAAVAWYASGQHTLGWILGLVSIVHHLTVYLLGERLLK